MGLDQQPLFDGYNHVKVIKPIDAAEHYSAVQEEFETRIDAIATVFAALPNPVTRDNNLPFLIAGALLDLGCNHMEVALGRERAGA